MAKARWTGGWIVLAMVTVVFLSSIVSSSPVPGSYWGSFRGDRSNSGTADSNLRNLSLKWEFKADSSIGTTVIAKGRTAIFGTFNGTVYSIDPELGRVDWKVNVGAPIYSTPAMDPELGVVYVCDNSGDVTCLYLENGSIKWQWRSGSGMAIQSSPLVIEGGNIYFGSDDAYLYSLYPNGTLAWRFEGCSGWIYTSPSYYQGLIYFGSCDGKMRAVSASTGQEQWNFSTAYIPSSPAIYGGRIFFGAYDSNLYCLDALSGDLVWNTTMGDNIYSSPSVTHQNVVVGCNDGLLYCLDSDNGEIKWTLDLGPSSLETSPVISNDMVVVTYDQGLVIVHLSDGSIYQRFMYGDSRDISSSVYIGKIFFGDSQGYVYCLQKQISIHHDDNGHLDLNEELSVRRDVIYFIIAFIIILGMVIFIYFRRYKPLRGA